MDQWRTNQKRGRWLQRIMTAPGGSYDRSCKVSIPPKTMNLIMTNGGRIRREG